MLPIYIEAFCDRRRLHSSLGYLSPEAHERHYYYQQYQEGPITRPQG